MVGGHEGIGDLEVGSVQVLGSGHSVMVVQTSSHQPHFSGSLLFRQTPQPLCTAQELVLNRYTWKHHQQTSAVRSRVCTQAPDPLRKKLWHPHLLLCRSYQQKCTWNKLSWSSTLGEKIAGFFLLFFFLLLLAWNGIIYSKWPGLDMT